MYKRQVLSADLLSFFPNPVSAGPVLSLPHFGAGPKSCWLLSPSTQLSRFLSCHICHKPSHHPSNSSSPHTQAPWQIDCTMLCFCQSVLVCIDVTDFSCVWIMRLDSGTVLGIQISLGQFCWIFSLCVCRFWTHYMCVCFCLFFLLFDWVGQCGLMTRSK